MKTSNIRNTLMKKFKYIIFIFSLITLGVFTIAMHYKGNFSEKEIHIKVEQLSLKGDTAFAFCKANQMNTDFCFLVDMGIHSGKYRFFVWSFSKDTIIAESLCAHGSGGKSTKDKPEFSNVPGSLCTSLGKYKVGARSYSKWGINIHYKLHGLEKTNDKAFERIVVLHSYDPICQKEIYPLHLPLGYSQGCPVICNELMKEIDEMLKNQKQPTLLWIYEK